MTPFERSSFKAQSECERCRATASMHARGSNNPKLTDKERFGHQAEYRSFKAMELKFGKRANHYDTKAKKMSEVLAAFRTNILPITTDRGVVLV